MSEIQEEYRYKADQGKPRLDLVPPGIIEAVGQYGPMELQSMAKIQIGKR
jgi:hypothetical protein